MTKATHNYTRVFLRDFAAKLRVGILTSEKRAPQTVIVNLECEAAVRAPLRRSRRGKSRSRAIDYRQVHDFIAAEMPTMPHIPLLESAAEMIADFCLRDPRIASVRVRLEKPNIFPNVLSAGVEIFRTRSGV